MPAKRRREEENLTGRERKRVRTSLKRQIKVQNIRSDPIGQPSGSIDAQRFLDARSFEINALETSMRSAKNANGKRSFQSLPRHLRRRAASHNLRRLPRRLRPRAVNEIKQDKTKSPVHIKFRKLPFSKKVRLKLPRSTMLAKRQMTNKWLETHLWHAKRMKMVEKWGYRLAEKPTDKAFRPSYRAAKHGCITNDISYHQTIQLEWTRAGLSKILDLMRDPFAISPAAPQYINGLRECRTNLYTHSLFPHGLLGPVTIIWQCSGQSQTTSNIKKWEEVARKHDEQKKAQKDSRKQARSGATVPISDTFSPTFSPQSPQFSPQSPQISPVTPVYTPKGPQFDAAGIAYSLPPSFHFETPSRPPSPTESMVNEAKQVLSGPNAALWVVCHPAIADAVQSALAETIESLQRGLRTALGTVPGCICRLSARKFNIFRFVGPKAGQQVAKVLAASSGSSAAKRAVCSILSFTQNAQDHVQFLEKLAQGETSVPELIVSLCVKDPRNLSKTQPTEEARSEPTLPNSSLAIPSPSANIWSSNTAPPSLSKQDIDNIRASSIVPSQRNAVTEEQEIPILLSRSRLGDVEEHAMEVITLYIPQRWGGPFWTSLMSASCRVGGLREIQQQHYEAGDLYFPTDYMKTAAQTEQAELQATKSRVLHARMPSAKRPNYSKLKTISPFAFDWPAGDTNSRFCLLSPATLDSLLPAAEQRSITASMFVLCMKRSIKSALLLPNVPRIEFFHTPTFLVTVRLVPLGRGTPRDRAHVYTFRTPAALKAAVAARSDLEQQEVAINAADEIKGYVTTGGFSLSRGGGFAIATVALEALFNTLRDSRDLNQQTGPKLTFGSRADRVLMIYKNIDALTGRYCMAQLL